VEEMAHAWDQDEFNRGWRVLGPLDDAFWRDDFLPVAHDNCSGAMDFRERCKIQAIDRRPSMFFLAF
jgi:hypothetical protein